MWLNRSLVYITDNPNIFQNKNCDSCRHVSLELETVIFNKKDVVVRPLNLNFLNCTMLDSQSTNMYNLLYYHTYLQLEYRRIRIYRIIKKNCKINVSGGP